MKTLALNYAPAQRKEKNDWVARALKHRFFQVFDRLTIGQITLKDGDVSRTCGQGDPTDIVVHIQDYRFYTQLAFGGAVGAAEAYMMGFWRCDQLTALIRLLLKNRDVLEGLDSVAIKRSFNKLVHKLNEDTETGSKKNIAAHYDLGNDLFEQFLDPTMTYSSGFFEHQQASMEHASTAKLDRICKKLNLNKNDRIIEIGTGWGSFALHAAANYGCHVTTTTISEEQFQLAKKRVKHAGLEEKITLLKQDYRHLQGSYDKLVSIEMIEAVGLKFLGTFLKKCSDLLKPEGQMLIQSITISDQNFDYASKNVDFIQRYIFPGGALPSITTLANEATKNTDLRLYALEDITPHYAMTLRKWREKFYENVEEIKKLGYDNQFLRMWEYYLCYCEGGFAERAIGCVHVEFHKPKFDISKD